MAVTRYEYIPKAPKAARYLVTELTPRAVTLGLRHGDVIEVGERGVLVLRPTVEGPPQKHLDSLIVSGTLRRLDPAA